MAEQMPVPSWITVGAQVGVRRQPGGSLHASLSLATIKSITKTTVTTESTLVGGKPDRWSLRDLTRREGGSYGTVYQMVDPSSRAWKVEVAAHNNRMRLRRAQFEADLWSRGRPDSSGREVTAVDVLRAVAPVAGLPDDAVQAILAALPAEEQS